VDAHSLRLLDWSIKSSLELEYTPPPAATALLHADSALVQQDALRQFLMAATDRSFHHTTASKESARDSSSLPDEKNREAAVQWQAGLLYWQHPATYPLPAHFLPHSTTAKGSTSSSAAIGKARQSEVSSSSNRNINNKSKLLSQGESSNNNGTGSRSLFASMPPPRLPQQQQQAFAVLGSNHHNNNSEDRSDSHKHSRSSALFWETRAREWREAVRSLYMIWMERIRQLNAILRGRNRSSSSSLDECWVQQICDLYFYGTGQGHTVLFRVGVERHFQQQDDGSTTTLRLVPEIVLSSSTLALREKLRSMGVTLMLLDSWHGMKGEFEEEAMVRSTQSMAAAAAEASARQLEDSSPNIKAELVALRRAQVFGQTVGADVSVQVHAKKNGSNNLPSRSPKRIPPLYMTGMDDCAAFFEVYYNTCGQMGMGKLGSGNNNNNNNNKKAHGLSHDVPLLLCRKLGPFLHATIQSVRSSTRTSKTFGGGGVKDHQQPPATTSSIIELQGHLLPCAVRDLVCASVNAMLADDSRRKVESEACEKKNETVGSHHFTVRPTAYAGEEASGGTATTLGSSIGTHCSKGLNGAYSVLMACSDVNCDDEEGDDESTQYCRHGELLMLAAWDIQRPKSLAYKLEHVSGSLLG